MNRAALLALVVAPLLGAIPLCAKPAETPATAAAQITAVKSKLSAAPLQFEENRGQAPAEYDFLSRGGGCSVLLRSNEARFVLVRKGGVASASLKLDAASEAKGQGLQPLDCKVNYLKGKTEKSWIKDIPTSGRVKYEGIYKGVDLVYYGNQQTLEYDFIVAPHGDPRAISWTAEGASDVKIGKDGALEMTIGGSAVSIKKPIAYQLEKGKRKGVDVNYKLVDNHIHFALASYDTSKELIIDPVVQFVYSSYMGGTTGDCISSIAVDKSGAVYLGGWSLGTGVFPVAGSPASAGTFPTTGGVFQPSHAIDANKDGLIIKVSPDGSQIVEATYLGGSGGDEVNGIALDPTGNIYVAGNTTSPDFPTMNAAQPSSKSSSCGFIAKLSNGCNQLVYSTYIGNEGETAKCVAVNSNGVAYVGGVTPGSYFYGHTPYDTVNKLGVFSFTVRSGQVAQTTDLIIEQEPRANGAPSYTGQEGAIEGALNALTLVQAEGTFTAKATAKNVATNTNQREYTLTLTTVTYNDPGTTLFTPGILTHVANAFSGAFPSVSVVPILVSGSTVLSGTQLITSGSSSVLQATYTTDFDLKIQLKSGANDSFILAVNPDGSFNTASTSILGGAGLDSLNAIAVDINGNVYFTGGTEDLLKKGTYTTVRTEPFIGKSDGLVRTFVIQTEGEGNAVAVDLVGDTPGSVSSYFAGTVLSADLPLLNNFQGYPDTLDRSAPGTTSSGYNGFVMKMNSDFNNILWSTYLGGSKNDYVRGLAVDFQHYIYVTGETESADFPTLGDAPNLPVVAGNPAVQSSDHAHGNAFLSVFAPAGNALRYSTYFGGSEVEWGFAVGLTPARNPVAYVAGYTLSDDFPATAGAVQNTAYHLAHLPDTYTSGFISAFQDNSVDLWLESIVADTDPPVPGQPLTYTVTVKNVSAVDAESAVVYQNFSDSLTFVSGQGANIASFTGGALGSTRTTVVATLGPVLAGREVSYRIVVVPTGPQVISTTATVQSEHDTNALDKNFTLTQVARPVVSLKVTKANASEDGSTGVFTFSRRGDLSLPLTIKYSIAGTATNGSDYVTLPGTVLMPAGAASVDVTIAPLADTVQDPGETVVLGVLKGSDYELDLPPATLSGSISIQDIDPDVVNLLVPDGNASKIGKTATFTVSRQGNLGQSLNVGYSLFGSATNGKDYRIIGDNGQAVIGASGTVSIPAGSNSANVVITPIPDSESGQPVAQTYVGLQLLPGSAYLSGTAAQSGTATIADVSPDSVSVSSWVANAYASGTNGVFRVTRLGDAANDAANPLTIQYSMAGTAVNGVDYVKLTGIATIAAGDNFVDIPLVPLLNASGTLDTVASLTISPPNSPGLYSVNSVSASATISVHAYNGAVVTVSALRPLASVSGTTGLFQIKRTGSDFSSPLVVAYQMSGQAVSGGDYQILSGLATIPANAATTSVELIPISSPLGSGSLAAVMTLLPTQSCLIGTQSSATVTVSNFAAPVQALVNLSVLSGSANDAGLSAVVRVTRSGNLSVPILVNYSLGGSATNGGDYQLLPNSITIPAGNSTADIVITPRVSTTPFPTKLASVQVASGVGYDVGANSYAAVTIDFVPAYNVSIQTTGSSASENGDLGKVTITRTGDLSVSLDVPYKIGGTAVNGTDYEHLTGLLTIPAGASSADIVIAPLGTTLSGSSATVDLTIVPSGAYNIVGPKTTTVSIANGSGPSVSIVASGTNTAALGGASFKITRTGVTTSPLSVYYALAGTGTNGVSYVTGPNVTGTSGVGIPLTGIAVIPAGQFSVVIPIIPRYTSSITADQTVIMQLSVSPQYKLSANRSDVVTISSALAPVVSIAADPTATNVFEGLGSMRVIFTRAGGNLAQSLKVSYHFSTAALVANNYYRPANFGAITFLAGKTTAVLSIPTIDNKIVQQNLPLTVVVDSTPLGSGYAIAAPGQATVTIVDNDLHSPTFNARKSTTR